MPSELLEPQSSPPAGIMAPAVAIAARPWSALALPARLFRSRGMWALGDQGVLSLGNFFTNLLLANHLAPDLYGIYFLALSVVWFLNSLHAAFVVYPLTVRGAMGDKSDLQRLTTRSTQLTLLLAPIMVLGMIWPAATAHRWALLPVAAGAAILWQVQETLRRALMARLRHAWAVPGDAISYLGQAAGVWLLARAGRLTPESAFAVIGLSSALAALVQASQLHLKPRPAGLLSAALRDHWRLGRSLLGTNLLTLGTIYLSPWLLEASHGRAAMGKYGALMLVMGLTNPIFTGLSGLTIPAVAAARRHGVAAARHAAIKYAGFGAILLVPIFLLLALFPGAVLSLFFHKRPEYVQLTAQLRLMVLSYCVYFAGQVCTHVLNGLERSEGTLHATLLGAIVTVIVCTPCVILFGLNGVLWSGLVPIIAQAVLAAALLRRAFADERIKALAKGLG